MSRLGIVSNVCGNGYQKLLVIGNTGVGKSSLCNMFSGKSVNSNLFPASDKAVSCTQDVRMANSRFNGHQGREFTIIDTIGLMDGARDDDSQIIKDLKDSLQKNCDYINLFVIVVNGTQHRFDSGLIQTFTLFETMFGREFWKQSVLVFTHLSMDCKNIRKREKIYSKSDFERAREFAQTVESKFPESSGLEYTIIDACRDQNDEVEEITFQSGMEKVWLLLTRGNPLSTDRISDAETKTKAAEKQAKELNEEVQKTKEKQLKMQQEFEEKERKMSKDREVLEQKVKTLQIDGEKQLEELKKMTDKQKEEHERINREAKDQFQAKIAEAVITGGFSALTAGMQLGKKIVSKNFEKKNLKINFKEVKKS